MRKLLLMFVVVASFALLGATAGTAAPSEVSATYGPKAQFVTPTTILVPVTVTCPATFVTAFAQAFVSQSDTGGTGSGFTEVPCTGGPETMVMVVEGGPFTLGQAVLRGFGIAGFQFDEDIRKIQIVL